MIYLYEYNIHIGYKHIINLEFSNGTGGSNRTKVMLCEKQSCHTKPKKSVASEVSPMKN